MELLATENLSLSTDSAEFQLGGRVLHRSVVDADCHHDVLDRVRETGCLQQADSVSEVRPRVDVNLPVIGDVPRQSHVRVSQDERGWFVADVQLPHALVLAVVYELPQSVRVRRCDCRRGRRLRFHADL